jgi:hypothetical protein
MFGMGAWWTCPKTVTVTIFGRRKMVTVTVFGDHAMTLARDAGGLGPVAGNAQG